MYTIPVNPDLSENVHYNFPAFPAYIRRGRLSFHPRFRAISHWHSDLEFILILQGIMDYNVNGDIIPLEPGTGLFVNSRCFHFGFSDQQQDCEFLCILLHPDLLTVNTAFFQTYLEPVLENPGCPYQKLAPDIPWQKDILNALRTIEQASHTDSAPFLILSQFAQIMHLLFTHTEHGHAINTRERDSVNAMVAFIQQHYQESITQKDIAAAGNCCRTYCAARFQSYLGNSPGTYLRLYRLERGAELLRRTTQTVTEISYNCGFSSTSYFCECFRRRYGMSPKAFRLEGFGG